MASGDSVRLAADACDGRGQSQNELVACYLQQAHYTYTLSVFVAEAALDPAQSYTAAAPVVLSVQVPANTAVSVVTPKASTSTSVHRLDRSEVQMLNGNVRAIADRLFKGLAKKYEREMRRYENDQAAAYDRKAMNMQQMCEQAVYDKEKECEKRLTRELAELRDRENQLHSDAWHERKLSCAEVEQKQRALLDEHRQLQQRIAKFDMAKEQFKTSQARSYSELEAERTRLAEREAALEDKELRAQDTLQHMRKHIHKQEMQRYERSLQSLTQSEQQLRAHTDHLQHRLAQAANDKLIHEQTALALAQLKAEHSQCAQELEHSQQMNERLRQELIEKADHHQLQSQVQTLKQQLHSANQLTALHPQVLQAQNELDTAHRHTALLTREHQLRTDQCNLQLQQEKSRNSDLMASLKSQADELRAMHSELERLKVQVSTAQLLPRTLTHNQRSLVGKQQRAVALRIAHQPVPVPNTLHVPISPDSDTDCTPEHVLQARREQNRLHAQAQAIEQSVYEYKLVQDVVHGSAMNMTGLPQPQTPITLHAPASSQPIPAVTHTTQAQAAVQAQSSTSVTLPQQQALQPTPVLPAPVPVPVPSKQPELVPESADETWLRRISERKVQSVPETEVSQPAQVPRAPNSEPPVPEAAPVDAVMQQYMQMVLANRQKQSQPVEAKVSPRLSPKQKSPEPELARVEPPAPDDDFDW